MSKHIDIVAVSVLTALVFILSAVKESALRVRNHWQHIEIVAPVPDRPQLPPMPQLVFE